MSIQNFAAILLWSGGKSVKIQSPKSPKISTLKYEARLEILHCQRSGAFFRRLDQNECPLNVSWALWDFNERCGNIVHDFRCAIAARRRDATQTERSTTLRRTVPARAPRRSSKVRSPIGL